MANESGRIFQGTPEAEAARRAYEANLSSVQTTKPADEILEAAWLREMALRHGADDVGFVEISRPGLGTESDNARFLLPSAKSMLSIICKLNPISVRAPARSAANMTWHHVNDKLDAIAAEMCAELVQNGVNATAIAVGFPMEMAPQEGKVWWLLSHKIIAVEAGMGHMGTNRNVIHPRFGNFVLLNTIIIDHEIDEYNKPLDYNPCFGCNLCVAACPVGAIRTDEDFDLDACLGHNYREFIQFNPDWAETLTMGGGQAAYRSKFRDDETAVFLQAISFEPNYKSAYCMTVCPAGDELVGAYLADPKAHRDEVLKPLREYPEPVWVRSGTRSEQRALRNPHKWVRYNDYEPDLSDASNFAVGLRHMFQPAKPDTPRRVVSFRFHDGTVTAILDKGRLTTTIGVSAEVADAVVTSSSRHYITILHRHLNNRLRNESAEYTVEGDPAALKQLFDCLN